VKSVACHWNCVGLIFLTSSPQKLMTFFAVALVDGQGEIL